MSGYSGTEVVLFYEWKEGEGRYTRCLCDDIDQKRGGGGGWEIDQQ